MLWLVAGIGIFAVLSARVPADDGFGGFIPLWFAALATIAGLYASERLMIRRKPRP